jgi:hypothetical protein
MLQLEHMKRIVDACYPSWSEEAQELWRQQKREPSEMEMRAAWLEESRQLWHDIKPVKFGNSVLWAAGTLSFATYQTPEDAAYMLILRTECYTTTFIAAAPGFGQFSPPPNDTQVRWEYTDLASGNDQYAITPTVPVHILCDSDEMLFAKGDHLVELIATVSAPPDGNNRFIRTLVYGYLVGSKIAGRIGGGESLYFGTEAE